LIRCTNDFFEQQSNVYELLVQQYSRIDVYRYPLWASSR